jgi:hypothetical protein
VHFFTEVLCVNENDRLSQLARVEDVLDEFDFLLWWHSNFVLVNVVQLELLDIPNLDLVGI